jgi:pyruvate/2-oxoacid:ferredoxin oxidoreductase beta subunit
MNTGIQTSTATPYGAITTTSPLSHYKDMWPKDLMGIIAAHNVPYAATASLAFLNDFRAKIEKAKNTKGFRLLMVDGPCPPGHKTEPEISISVTRLAVESKVFPLFEVENQKYTINYFPERDIIAEECLKLQGRFKHLFRNGSEEILKQIQEFTDKNWQRLNELANNVGDA